VVGSAISTVGFDERESNFVFRRGDPMTRTKYVVSLEEIREAARRLDGVAHRTPVLTSATLDELAGRSVFLKCENFQKVGAFKFRGAYNAVACIEDAAAARGVVTHSSGNHAQALALAARRRGIPAYIVMPSNASAVKRRAVEGYGAEVVECEPTLVAREATAALVLEKTGATFVPPYDDPRVIAGQGTIGLELLGELPDLDGIVTPVGGGGLVTGVCLAAQALRPSIRVFGAEPKGADDAARSKAAGELMPQNSPKTIADGLLTSLGQLTWPVIRDRVEAVVTVGDDEIVRAMRFIWERVKIVIEPSAAVAVAAVLSDAFRELSGLERVGVVLSGGNVDLDRLPWR
jgi:threonine dehydratase/serine racemase